MEAPDVDSRVGQLASRLVIPEVKTGENLRLGESEYLIVKELGSGDISEVYRAKLVGVEDDLPEVVVKLPRRDYLSQLTVSSDQIEQTAQALLGGRREEAEKSLLNVAAVRVEGEIIEKLNRAEVTDWDTLTTVAARLKRAVETPGRKIIACLDSGYESGCPFVVQETAPSQIDINDFIVGKTGDEDRFLSLAVSLVEAMNLAHDQGIAFKDFDPRTKKDRIRVGGDRDGSEIKVIDWNVSGTRKDFSGDLRLLGGNLFHFCTGVILDVNHLPPEYEIGALAPNWDKLSFGLRQVIQRSLSRDPERSFRDAEAILDELKYLQKLSLIAREDGRKAELSGEYFRMREQEEWNKAATVAWVGLHSKKAVPDESGSASQWQQNFDDAVRRIDERYWANVVGAEISLLAGMYSQAAAGFSRASVETGHPAVAYHARVGALVAKICQRLKNEVEVDAMQEGGAFWKAVGEVQSAFEANDFESAAGSLNVLSHEYKPVGEWKEFAELKSWAEAGEVMLEAKKNWLDGLKETNLDAKLALLLKSKRGFTVLWEKRGNLPFPGVGQTNEQLDKEIEGTWVGFWQENDKIEGQLAQLQIGLGSLVGEKRIHHLIEIQSFLEKRSGQLASLAELAGSGDDASRLVRILENLRSRREQVDQVILNGGVDVEEIEELRRQAELSRGIFEILQGRGLVESSSEVKDVIEALLAAREAAEKLRTEMEEGRRLTQTLREAGIDPDGDILEQIKELRRSGRGVPGGGREAPAVEEVSPAEKGKDTGLILGSLERLKSTYPQLPDGEEMSELVETITSQIPNATGREVLRQVATALVQRLNLGGDFLRDWRRQVVDGFMDLVSPELAEQILEARNEYSRKDRKVTRLSGRIESMQKRLPEAALRVLEGELDEEKSNQSELVQRLAELENQVIDKYLLR